MSSPKSLGLGLTPHPSRGRKPSERVIAVTLDSEFARPGELRTFCHSGVFHSSSPSGLSSSPGHHLHSTSLYKRLSLLQKVRSRFALHQNSEEYHTFVLSTPISLTTTTTCPSSPKKLSRCLPCRRRQDLGRCHLCRKVLRLPPWSLQRTLTSLKSMSSPSCST